MTDGSRRKRPLGELLARQLERGVIVNSEAYLMFINQVEPEAIPDEVEAAPPAFRRALEGYVASLEVGGPNWDQRFLIGAIYHFGDRNPEEVKALYDGIACKNRATAEALLRYFKRRGTEMTK